MASTNGAQCPGQNSCPLQRVPKLTRSQSVVAAPLQPCLIDILGPQRDQVIDDRRDLGVVESVLPRGHVPSDAHRPLPDYQHEPRAGVMPRMRRAVQWRRRHFPVRPGFVPVSNSAFPSPAVTGGAVAAVQLASTISDFRFAETRACTTSVSPKRCVDDTAQLRVCGKPLAASRFKPRVRDCARR